MKNGIRTRADRVKVETETPGPSLTVQSEKEKCDINRIVGQYQKTGLVNHVRAQGLDYTTLPDNFEYHEAMNLVTKAQTAFEALPAEQRSRFANQPQRLLQFLAMPENRAEAEKLGLITPKPPEEPPPAQRAPAPTSEPVKA